ncbi:MAG: DUF1573 domain-containing protein [Phycisphaerales bacterium]
MPLFQGFFVLATFVISALAPNAFCESAVDPSSPQTATSSLQATIIVDPPLIKLGFIEPRSTITRNFRLINTSAKPVTIQSATPTCTCTTIEAQGKIIPPGESLEVPITMKVAASTGIKTAAVTFTFTGGIAPAKVEMSGEIAYAVRGTTIDVTNGAMVPYINAFQDPSAPVGTPSTPLSGTVTISSIDRSPFRINSVMGQPAVFVNFNPQQDAPRNNYLVSYDFSKIPCERMPPYLIIETDHPQAPVIDMRIRHACTKISPQLPFAEYRSNLGIVTTGKEQPFEFELKHSQGWKVISTTSKDPQFTVKLVGQRADADNAMISLMISANPSAHGIVLAPVTMTAMDPTGATKSSDFWVYFKAVPAASAPAASDAPAASGAPNASGAPAASQKAGS